MSLRTVIFWVHLAVGVSAALVVLMMSLTGVILTYEAQLNRWALSDYRSQEIGATPLPLEGVVERARQGAAGRRPTTLRLRSDRHEPAAVGFDEGPTLFVDRYTGEIRGTGDTAMWRFLRATMYWHRWFALEGDVRIVGRTFTATANLGFFFLILSGLYLWWPRRTDAGAWRRALWFRGGLRGRARDVNWHGVIGFWVAVPLVVIVASGATMSYQWAGDLVFRVFGEVPVRAVPAPDVRLSVAPRASGVPVALAAVVTSATAETPDWRSVELRLGDEAAGALTVLVDRGTGRQPSLGEELVVDRTSGAIVGRAGYPAYSRGLKARRWLRFAHTGEVYGVVGQTIAGVVSLAAVVLVWTGLAMSWRRFVGRSATGS